MRLSIALVVALLGLCAVAVAQQVPVVVTGEARVGGQTTAVLTGSVDPNLAETTYYFEYGTTTAYGLRTPDRSAGAGDDPVTVEVPIAELTAATTYHYRLVATNASGTVRGEDRTFRTASPPANPDPPRALTDGVRDRTAAGATLTARVDPGGGATSYRFEFGTSTRYGSTTPAQSLPAGRGYVAVRAGIAGLARNTRYHYRVVASNAAGVARGRDRTFTTLSEPTGVTISLGASAVVWGQPLTVSGRVAGSGVGGLTVALEASSFPFSAGFAQVGNLARTASNGTFRFTIPNLWTTTRLRAVTRTAPPRISTVATAFSRVRVGARARPGRRSYRLEGSVLPGVAGRASLQRRTRSGRWVPVRRARLRRLDATRSRYAFRVRRARTRRVYRVAVVPSDGGAHVRGTSRELAVRARRR